MLYGRVAGNNHFTNAAKNFEEVSHVLGRLKTGDTADALSV